jgi:DNA-directed RNA polymerase specialized sigma subunit
MIEHLLIEYSHIPERRIELQAKAKDAAQRKKDAEEMINTATRTSQTKFYTDRLSDTVSKIIDEYEFQLNFYYSELRNCNEKERKIYNALKELDYVKYQILVLRYFKRLPWNEISLKMNYSRQQCINIKNAAIAELKELCSG